MRAPAASAFAVALLALTACPSLKNATDPDAGAPDLDASVEPDATELPTTDAGDAAADAKPSFPTYEEAERILSFMRLPGPTTTAGSTGRCTRKHFFWRDSDQTMHSWNPKTALRVDYAFKGARVAFAASDAYLAVDVVPNYATLDVYQTGLVNTVVDSIPYAFNFVASDDGVVRLDQRVNNVDLNGTKVRHWIAATKQTEDITGVLPTQQPPSGFAYDKVVIPGSVTIPFPLHVVDVKAKTATTVTFDNAVGLRQTLPSPSGLLVSYARSGGTTGVRLYKGDKDDGASRVEIGDAIASRPPLFPDSPAGEHDVLARVATYGKDVVVYDSPYGLFAYDMAKQAIAPLQLGKDRKTFIVDLMCVVEDAGVMVYRLSGDVTGRIYWVDLAPLLP